VTVATMMMSVKKSAATLEWSVRRTEHLIQLLRVAKEGQVWIYSFYSLMKKKKKSLIYHGLL